MEAQHHRLWQQFDDALLTLATDPTSEQMDHDTFIGKYEWHVRSHLESSNLVIRKEESEPSREDQNYTVP